MSPSRSRLPMRKLDLTQDHSFEIPQKRINDGDQDLPFFLTSTAYADLTFLLLQLTIAMFPQKADGSSSATRQFTLDGEHKFSGEVQRLSHLLRRVDSLIDETPPDPGPRRFGNISFRRWYEKVEAQARHLVQEALPTLVLRFPADGPVNAIDEITPYLLGSLGSWQRLDYGTGHELSFLAFLGCIWKLGGFGLEDEAMKEERGTQGRAIVIGILQPYLELVRKLIKTYNLEPAGSHGVWGLDDHSFLPYIFGSAQLAPALPALGAMSPDSIPPEGSLEGAASVKDVSDKARVERLRSSNMYFSAIGFINDVKTGPFWEHSPVLYDISGITKGWAKVNAGMLKMYNAEVLGKFPVVQHFPFGSLFRWEKDPNARMPVQTAHSKAQAPNTRTVQMHTSTAHPASVRAPGRGAMAGPGRVLQATMLPTRPAANLPATSAPWTGSSNPASMLPPMRAPWAPSPSPSRFRHQDAPNPEQDATRPT